MTAAKISPEQERIIQWIARGIVAWAALAGLVGIYFGLEFTGGVLVGGGLAYLNFVWFASIVRTMLTGTSSRWGFGLKTGAKTLALYGAVGALIWYRLVDPIAFLVGLSGPLVAVAAAAVKFRRLGFEKKKESASVPAGGAEIDTLEE